MGAPLHGVDMSSSSEPEHPKRSWRTIRISRDTILFTAGLLLLVYEVVLKSGPAEPTLLILFAAMMGVPFMLGGKKSE